MCSLLGRTRDRDIYIIVWSYRRREETSQLPYPTHAGLAAAINQGNLYRLCKCDITSGGGPDSYNGWFGVVSASCMATNSANAFRWSVFRPWPMNDPVTLHRRRQGGWCRVASSFCTVFSFIPKRLDNNTRTLSQPKLNGGEFEVSFGFLFWE